MADRQTRAAAAIRTAMVVLNTAIEPEFWSQNRKQSLELAIYAAVAQLELATELLTGGGD